MPDPLKLPPASWPAPDAAWLTTRELAALAGVDVRIVKRAAKAGRWRGAALCVRQINNVAGRGKTWQIHADNLPPDLRQAWYQRRGLDLHAPGEAPAQSSSPPLDACMDARLQDVGGRAAPVCSGRSGTKAEGRPKGRGGARDRVHNDPERRAALARFKEALLAPIVAHPAGSAGRKAAIDARLATPVTFPDGRQKRLSRPTLYRWLRAFEQGRMSGLLVKRRRDAGRGRCILSRAFDARFGGLPAAELAALTDRLTRYINSQWASGQHGWRRISEQAASALYEWLKASDSPAIRAALAGLGEAELRRIVRVPRPKVEAAREFGLLAIARQDAKHWDDRYQPRIRRAYDDLAPMSIVVGDVHPMDVMLKRADGSTVYPRAIAWHCVGTNRLWYSLIALQKGEGIRREHIGASFASLCQAWGLPRLLYLDNGSEYKWEEMLAAFSDIARLSQRHMQVSGLDTGQDPEVAELVRQRRACVLRSAPYNAAGKPRIEGLFGLMEQGYMRLLPGWTGGERLDKKTHNVGREPRPYPRPWAEFHADIDTLLEAYHKRPQAGLAGESPNERYNRHIRAGWHKTTLSPDALRLAMSFRARRTADRGRVRFALPGRDPVHYYHDRLLPLTGQKLDIRVSVWAPDCCFVMDKAGHVLCVARPEVSYHPLDPAGCIERGRRRRQLTRWVSEQKRHCDRLDLIAETRRHNRHGEDAQDAPVAGEVDVAELNQMVEALDQDRAARLPGQPPPAPDLAQWPSDNALLAALAWRDDEQPEDL